MRQEAPSLKCNPIVVVSGCVCFAVRIVVSTYIYIVCCLLALDIACFLWKLNSAVSGCLCLPVYICRPAHVFVHMHFVLLLTACRLQYTYSFLVHVLAGHLYHAYIYHACFHAPWGLNNLPKHSRLHTVFARMYIAVATLLCSCFACQSTTMCYKYKTRQTNE